MGGFPYPSVEREDTLSLTGEALTRIRGGRIPEGAKGGENALGHRVHSLSDLYHRIHQMDTGFRVSTSTFPLTVALCDGILRPLNKLSGACNYSGG